MRSSISVSYAACITQALPGGLDTILEVGTLTGNITIKNASGTPVDGK